MLNRRKRKCCIGVVTNDKNNKTRHVCVERAYRHFLYDRVLRDKNKFVVHDEENISHLGDIVKIIESRPLSKTKRWVIIKIINQATSKKSFMAKL
jgi:small subunit ribosomal protein S17